MQDYQIQVDKVFDAIQRGVEALDEDCDLDITRGDGKLMIEREGAGKLILNRQSASLEIWLAEPGKGWHFAFKDAAWRCTKRGLSLQEALAPGLSALLGRSVSL